jgi:hypothetical protein
MAVVEVVTGTVSPLGYQQITNLSAAVGLTVPTGARRALVIAETQAVRWRADGTDPSATVGMPLAVATVLDVALTNLAVIKFFEQAASAKLNVHYFA